MSPAPMANNSKMLKKSKSIVLQELIDRDEMKEKEEKEKKKLERCNKILNNNGKTPPSSVMNPSTRRTSNGNGNVDRTEIMNFVID